MLSFIVLNHSKTWCYWISYENAYYYEMRDKWILWKLRFFQINFYVFVKLQWYLMSLEWSSLVWCNLLDRLIIIGLFMTKQPKACNNGCHRHIISYLILLTVRRNWHDIYKYKLYIHIYHIYNISMIYQW